MKYNFVGLFVAAFLIAHGAFSQKIPNIMSPETATLGRYGSYAVNYNTGSPSISVPLHQISESGVQIPITLNYDANGFIPNKNAGSVGFNWSLNTGGVITRVVNGVPDDKYDPNGENGSSANGTDKGYIYGQLHAGLQTYAQEYIRTNQYFSVALIGPSGFQQETPQVDLDYEYMPDIFSFNFLGHGGKFFMDNGGNVRVISDRKYKVDLINLKPQYNFQSTLDVILNSGNPLNSLNNELFSQIKMTADDGFQFFFGGSFKDIEINFSYDLPGHRYVNPKSGTINAWYLSKVITPDGEIIEFKNREYTSNDLTVIGKLFEPNSGSWNNLSASFLEIKYYRNHTIELQQIDGGGGTTSPILMNTQNEVYKSLVKQVYLSEIVTKLQKVKFNYTEKDLTNKFYNQPILVGGQDVTTANSQYHTSKVTSIQIWDNLNGPVTPFEESPLNPQFPTSQTILFSYDYRGGRMFLTDVQLHSTMKYTFLYSNSSTLPNPLTRGVDIWGYYNGKDGNTDLIGQPNIGYGAAGEYETNFGASYSNRLPDAAYSTYGILNTITYPTGGKTEFSFENHTYRKSLKRKVSSGITPVWETASSDQLAGGLRIKEIKNIPGTTTTYKYIKDYDQNQNNSSSGLLVNGGVNFVYFHRPISGGTGFIHTYISDNNIEAASSYGESHISYNEVIEINGEGFTKYRFSTHETNPDTYSLGDDSYKITNEYSQTNFNNQLKRIYKYSDRAYERGKLLKTEVFNNSNQLVRSVENTYNIDPERTNIRTLGTNLTLGFTAQYYLKWFGLQQSYALYYYHNQVTKTVEKEYGLAGTTPLTQTTVLKYRNNIDPTVIESSVLQSDGSVLTSKFKYVEDFAATGNVYQGMKDQFIVSPLVEETILINDNPVAINKYNYSLFNGATYKLSSQKTINEKIQPGVEQSMLTVNAYNSTGMITEANKAGDHKLSYIWDYKNLLAIAQISNANSSSVAHTSFEADGTGGWTFSSGGITIDPLAPTGKKIYTLTGNNLQVTNNVTTASHIVSYWSNNGQYSVSGTQSVKGGSAILGWTYYEHTIINVTSVSISGTGKIDEVRLYPQGALMKTFTYEPLAGVTSQSDENGIVTYFDYDAIGRLKHIRDEYRNVVKKICYNFADQPEDCSIAAINTNPNWQGTGAFRCQLNGSGQNTGYWENEEKDMNPNSPSSDDTRWVQGSYNPTACPLTVTLTYQNIANASGYTATFTNTSTSQTYSFAIPSSGTGTLGNIPTGTYNVTIIKTTQGIPPLLLFGTGCHVASGDMSATFYNVDVGNCHHITLDWDWV